MLAFPKVPYADSLTLLLNDIVMEKNRYYLRFGISDTNLANTDNSDFNTTLGFVGLTLSYFVTGPVNRFGARNFGGADLPSSAGRYAAMTMEACPDQACGTNLGILSVRTSDDYFLGPPSIGSGLFGQTGNLWVYSNIGLYDNPVSAAPGYLATFEQWYQVPEPASYLLFCAGSLLLLLAKRLPKWS